MTAQSNTPIQCLDAHTGAIVFTLPFAEKGDFDDEAILYKAGFVVKTFYSVLLISLDGKLIKEFKIS